MTVIESVRAELAREPQLWWGHTTRDGWLILDRQDPRHAGEGRYLIRCRDWCEWEVSRIEFSSKQFVSFKNHLSSLPEAGVHGACDQLLALRREFFHRTFDPTWRFGVLRRLSLRKLRLLGIACCRRIWHLMEDDCRQAFLLAERLVEGENPAEEIPLVRSGIGIGLAANQGVDGWENSVRHWALWAARSVLSDISDPYGPAKTREYASLMVLGSSSLQEKDAEVLVQARLLRDIAGNPYRPILVAPGWRTPIVLSLADAIYQERSFEQMPILADALEDSGCDNEEILKHCREEKEHVRGCWVLDLLLDRA